MRLDGAGVDLKSVMERVDGALAVTQLNEGHPQFAVGFGAPRIQFKNFPELA